MHANRLTIRAKIADAALLAGLQAELLRPETVNYVRVDSLRALEELRAKRPAQREDLDCATAEAEQKLRYLGLAHRDAQLEQLAVDPRRTPQRIGRRELPDEGTQVVGDWQTPCRASTLPAPEQPKDPPVPADKVLVSRCAGPTATGATLARARLHSIRSADVRRKRGRRAID
jgi:hypothetical protein